MKIVIDRLETSAKVSDQMREVRREAVDISSDVYKLKSKLASLEPQWDTKLGMAQENGKFIELTVKPLNGTYYAKNLFDSITVLKQYSSGQ